MMNILLKAHTFVVTVLIFIQRSFYNLEKRKKINNDKLQIINDCYRQSLSSFSICTAQVFFLKKTNLKAI